MSCLKIENHWIGEERKHPPEFCTNNKVASRGGGRGRGPDGETVNLICMRCHIRGGLQDYEFMPSAPNIFLLLIPTFLKVSSLMVVALFNG